MPINCSYEVRSSNICAKLCAEEMLWNSWKRLVWYSYWYTTTSFFIFPFILVNKLFFIDSDFRPVITAFGIHLSVSLVLRITYQVCRMSEGIPYTAVLRGSSSTKYTPPGTWCYFFPHITYIIRLSHLIAFHSREAAALCRRRKGCQRVCALRLATSRP